MDNISCDYEKLLNKKYRKKFGTYYTPDTIIEYILNNTLKEENLLENPFIKILDPACGAGFFLIKIYEELYKSFTENLPSLKEKYYYNEYVKVINGEEKKVLGAEYWSEENLQLHIVKNCIYGADIDTVAVNLTKKAFLQKIKELKEEDLNIVCCDSLIKWETIGEAELLELREYIKELRGDNINLLKKFWSNKFNCIVGNPPFVVLMESELNKKFYNYIVRHYKTFGYKKNAFVALIERSFNILKESGMFSFIIPDRYFLTNSYQKSREYLIKNSKIISIAQIHNKVFEEAIVGTAIFVIKKEEKNLNHKVKFLLNYVDNNSYQFKSITQKEFLKYENCPINIITNGLQSEIIKKIDTFSCRLKEYTHIHVGMMVKNKEKFLKSNSCGSERILLGKDINRYFINNEERFFLPETIEIFGGTKDIKKHKCSPKLLLRKTGNSIKACLDYQGFFVEQSLYMILPKNNEENLFNILGQLNSSISNFYYSNTLITNPKTYPYIQHYDVEKLPINKKVLKNTTFTKKSKEIVNYINIIKSLSLRDIFLENDEEKIINKYNLFRKDILKLYEKLIELEEDLNNIIYETYGFTEDEKFKLKQYSNCEFSEKSVLWENYSILIEELEKYILSYIIKILDNNKESFELKEITQSMKHKMENFQAINKLIAILYNKDFYEFVKNILSINSFSLKKYNSNKKAQSNNFTIVKSYNRYFLSKYL